MKALINKLKLPSVSLSSLDVLRILEGDDISQSLLEKAICKDPILSGALLKYANSPLYRRHVEITNVRNAISLLGVKNVRAAVMISMMRSYNEPINLIKQQIWEHTISVTVLCRMLAHKCCRKLTDDIELTTLMHNIGGMILCSNYHDEYKKIIIELEKNTVTLHEKEYEVFGIKRKKLTNYVANNLRLPTTSKNAFDLFYSNTIPEKIDKDSDWHVIILFLSHILIVEIDEKNSVYKINVGSKEEFMALAKLDSVDVDDISDEFKNNTEKLIYS